MRAVNGVRVLFTLLCAGILGLAFFIAIDQISDPVLPELPFINPNSVVAALVVLVLINVASFQTINAEKKKYQVNGALFCPACKDKVKEENYQVHLKEETEKAKWTEELNAMTKADAALRSVVQDWTAANGNAEPARPVVAELVGAMNMEKAGNYEGAAKVFESQKLWTLAGKVREKNRIQMVKHVTVDMNQLLDQIGTRGLAVPYKCQNCGAGITIDKNSNVTGLKFCSYCGTAYNIEDMSKIVQEALAI
jgi:predicted Zn-ribbon and HTH transcriptional regulator